MFGVHPSQFWLVIWFAQSSNLSVMANGNYNVAVK